MSSVHNVLSHTVKKGLFFRFLVFGGSVMMVINKGINVDTAQRTLPRCQDNALDEYRD